MVNKLLFPKESPFFTNSHLCSLFQINSTVLSMFHLFRLYIQSLAITQLTLFPMFNYK